MKIVLPRYATNYNLIPITDEKTANQYNFTFNHTNGDEQYVVYWGVKDYNPEYGFKYGVMETGFFNEANFIDTIGNYQYSSLNSYYGYKMVEEFELNGRKSAKEIIFNLPENKQSKYNPMYNEIEECASLDYDVVLALQNPTDRSIYSTTSKANYYRFIVDCCKYYGNNLFVKFHPWNSGDRYTELEELIKGYGCNYGKVSIDIINKAQFVISYNSTFAVDCLLRDIPFVQYGLGTFYNAYGVVYSKQTFPTNVEKKTDLHKLCDFLIHKYCFYKQMDPDKFAKMIEHFSNSNDIFPMTDDFSYASNCYQS